MIDAILADILTEENLRLFGIGSTIALGILAQWLAWRWRIPSILLLLAFGLLAGPVTGLLNPDALFGETLLPIVSAAVAVILFEGGLSLKFSEIQGVRAGVRSLIFFGAAITFSLATLAAHFILGLALELAALIGGILIVTGPTVITPLLRSIRPRGAVGSVLRWEGIVTDPIGALVAVVLFEVVLLGDPQGSALRIILEHGGVDVQGSGLLSLFMGLLGIAIAALLGWLGARNLAFLLRRYLIPDYLQNAVALAVALGFYTLANLIQRESGLLTVTVMGIALANRRDLSIKHILEFKENLVILLVSSLFILLSERLPAEDLLAAINWPSVAFLAVLILVIRPAAVLISTQRSGMTLRERLFIAWMAPRGIVAAATASVFALELTQHGYEGAEQIAPLIFLVIIVTVAVYGLTAPWVARRLGLASSGTPQGILIVGAHDWARDIAGALKAADFRVVLLDTNLGNVRAAQDQGLQVHYGSVLSEHDLEHLEPTLYDMGRLLALTSNDEVNSVAVVHFREQFGQAEVYRLAARSVGSGIRETLIPERLQGRLLFGSGLTFDRLDEFARGAEVRTVELTESFTYAQFHQQHGAAAIPLFLIAGRTLTVVTANGPTTPRAGQTLMYLLKAEDTPFTGPGAGISGGVALTPPSESA